MDDSQQSKSSGFKWLAISLFIAVGGYYLITEHRAHLLGWWPLLFVLACPLMHFFMHGHGDHGGHGDEPKPPTGNRSSDSTHQH
jgi:hypothetical protein